MRTDAARAKPTLAPLRAASDVLDAVEGDLESIQRDLVLAERVGRVTLAVGVVVLAGVVAVAVVRRSRARHAAVPAVPEAAWPPVPVATDGPAPPAP
jgi:hypothetical protein